MRFNIGSFLFYVISLSLAGVSVAALAWELSLPGRIQSNYSRQTIRKDPNNVIWGGEHYDRLARVADIPAVVDPVFSRIPQHDLCRQVVGVVVDGQSYAFLLDKLSMVNSHLVGFSTGRTDYVVSHCNISGCTRVFSEAETQISPKRLRIAGVQMDGRMVVKLDETRYTHDSPALPFSDVPYEVTPLWKWQQEHPGTLYYGDRQSSSAAAP